MPAAVPQEGGWCPGRRGRRREEAISSPAIPAPGSPEHGNWLRSFLSWRLSLGTPDRSGKARFPAHSCLKTTPPVATSSAAPCVPVGEGTKTSKQTTKKNPKQQKTSKAKRAPTTAAGARSAEGGKEEPHGRTQRQQLPTPTHPAAAILSGHSQAPPPPPRPGSSSPARLGSAQGGGERARWGGRAGGAAGPPGRWRHHVPLRQRPLRPFVLVLLPPPEGGRLVGVPRLPL